MRQAFNQLASARITSAEITDGLKSQPLEIGFSQRLKMEMTCFEGLEDSKRTNCDVFWFQFASPSSTFL